MRREVSRTDNMKAMKSRYDTGWENMIKPDKITVKTSELTNEFTGPTNEESFRQLYEWNRTKANYPSDKCIHHLFEEQVTKTPDNIAVIYEDDQATYSELNTRANQLAHYLSKEGVKEGSIVALFVERGIDMVSALLAISKTGATYLPLDPIYPKARLELVLEDAKPVVFLTQRSLLDLVPQSDAKFLFIDDKEKYSNEPTDNLPYGNPLRPLYILFTSGSTGKPKGVPVLQHSTVNVVNVFSKFLKVTPQDIMMTVTTIAFDLAELDIYLALLNGAKLVLGTTETAMSMEKLINRIESSNATIFQATPITYKMLIQAGWKGKQDLKIISGGDAMPRTLAMELLKRTREFWNCYGPTETTIYNTAKKVTQEDGTGEGIVSIGKAFDNNTMYILDEEMKLVPVGITGELYIGGAGLSPGYLNNPELTASKFMRNPFSRGADDIIYKTGDLIKYLPDGNMAFIARADHQVKIRGFRIELGEIESNLRGYSGIKEAVVIARENASGEKILVAYYTTDESAHIRLIQLRNFLKTRLPDYMIPSILSELEKIPLTVNNKVDRRALANADLPKAEEEEDFVAPSTAIEIRLAEIWTEILKTDKIGIHTGFFELGGHSLLATQLIARIKKEFNVELPFRSIFDQITISGLVKYIEEHSEIRQEEKKRSIPKSAGGRDEYPLSSSQKRIWFMENYNPGIRAYNIPLDYHIEGDLDIKVLEKALDHLIRRHESFRTIFPEVNGEPVQKIMTELPANLSVVRLEREPNEKVHALIKQYSSENANYKFNLETGPLYRFQILVTGEKEFTFLINIHHIITDAISLSIFMDELGEVYHSLINNENKNLPANPISYTDFALFENQWLSGKEYGPQLEFWKKELNGVPGVLQLPIDLPRPREITYHGTEYHFDIEPELKDKLAALSTKMGTGLSMSLLSAYAILLKRYSQQEDFVVGFPVANRTYPELESLTGVFINTLPIRFTFPDEITVPEVIGNTTKRFLSAYENQEIPVDLIVEELKLKRSPNINPLFQVLFNYLAGYPNEVKIPGTNFQLTEGERVAAQFDLTLTVNDQRPGFKCTFEYNTDLFREDTIARMAGHYLTLLRGIAENETLNIEAIPLLTDRETRVMLEEWNKTSLDYPKEKCIHHLFEEQVIKTPDAVAVVFENEQMTYSELNVKANRLARYLVKQGVKEGDIVAICVHRSIDLIAGLLAISKSGATYLPLDPIYPKARLALILEDANPLLMVSESSMTGNLPETGARIVLLDKEEEYSSESAANLPYGDSNNPAYILYTSGSTGKPKGVQIKQHSLVNLVRSFSKLLQVTNRDILLAETTISFDIAELEMYLPLISGAKLVIATEETALNVELLKSKLDEADATIFQATPVTYRMLILSGWKGKKNLKVVSGGEAFPKELAREVLSRCKEVWNCYGPTETTIYSTGKKLTPDDHTGEGYVSIGRALDNTTLFVLNQKLMPVPVGIAGELYIGGDGVSTGYLNLPGMTSDRFIQDPFSKDHGSRIYKTGDVVQYLPDGNLIYLNRADNQVKIRGFRIEPGEIESVIAKYEGVKENVVITRVDGQGEKILVAYYVTDKNQGLNETELRQYLKEKLPDYMVPSAIVVMDKLPVTANNKVDRKALPEPELFSTSISKEYLEPKTVTEKKLAAIWSTILKIEKIGILDDFFEIGGHSMIAVTMIIKIEKEFGIRLPLAILFEQSNIQKLSKVIDNGIVPDKWRSLVPLRPAGSKKPLFLIHGLGLNVLLYTTIINYLDPEQPVYGLQARGLNGTDQPLETIEEIAKYYISEIMTVDSEGPYQLAGYSLGGNIAYEMSRQLTAMGKKVSFTGLLDAAAEGPVNHSSIFREIASGVKYALTYTLWNISYFFKTSKESKFSIIQRRWRGLWKKMRGMDIEPSTVNRASKGEEKELPKYMRRVHRANRRAGRRYYIKSYSGQVHLFKAEHQTFYISDPVNYGWDKYARGGVVIHEVPGEHSSTFAPPNDRYFSAILQRSLDETMRQS